MPTLHDLPAELLYQIHLLSLSSTLPLVSSHLHSLFHHTSPHHRAQYLRLRHDKSTLTHAVRYPICDLTVVHELERIAPLISKGGKKKLRCSELPARLAKGLNGHAQHGQQKRRKDNGGEEDDGDRQLDLPLIRYLLETYQASPDKCRKGYFLAKAVAARHVELIQLLLRHGADPGLGDGYAVRDAIGTGDLDLVRLLMEKEVEGEAEMEDEPVLVGGGGKKRKAGSGGPAAKRRRRTVPRCQATSEMLQKAVKGEHWRIVDYLTERGARPSLDVLRLL